MYGEVILKISGIVAAITIIGGAVLWIYNTIVTEPYNRELCKAREEQARQLKDALAPLTQALDRLNYLLEESELDIGELHEINVNQNKQLGDHEVRIVVLENFKKDYIDYHYKKGD